MSIDGDNWDMYYDLKYERLYWYTKQHAYYSELPASEAKHLAEGFDSIEVSNQFKSVSY